ncbi:MAG TPA: helix-turn-helix domain-containing protein [Stenomitos sp.]
MKELHRIEHLSEAKTLLNPIRISLLRLLREPQTCTDLARKLEMTPQRVNNHLKELLQEGLIEKVGEQTKRNLVEGIYQAIAKAYWLSPRLLQEGCLGSDERLSLNNLLLMAERLQDDVTALLSQVGAEAIPSVGVTAEIRLAGAHERERFIRDYTALMQELLQKYQGTGPASERYTAMLLCYPVLPPATDRS